MTDTAALKPCPITLQFHYASVTPGNSPGTMAMTMLLNENVEGRRFCFPAYYLNQYPLETDDDAIEKNDDGYGIFTGWFYDESNFDDDNCYHQVQGKPIAWALIPSAATVSAALSEPAQDVGAVHPDVYDSNIVGFVETNGLTIDNTAREWAKAGYSLNHRETLIATITKLEAERDVLAYKLDQSVNGVHADLIRRAEKAEASLAEMQRELDRANAEWCQLFNDKMDALTECQSREAVLREALEKSREGWANVIELKLVPPQHIHTAEILHDDAKDALKGVL